MGTILILLGIGCIVGAIVGGGVKMSHLEIPKFSSIWRQLILAVFGLIMLLTGLARNASEPEAAGSQSAQQNPAAPPPAEQAEGEDSPRPRVTVEPRNISGAWTDVDRNRIVFDLAQGTFTLTPSGSSNSYSGKVTASDNHVEWRFDGGGSLCRGTLSSDGQAMSGTCADAQDGEEVPIVLNRARE